MGVTHLTLVMAGTDPAIGSSRLRTKLPPAAAGDTRRCALPQFARLDETVGMSRMKRNRHFLRRQEFWELIVQHWLQRVVPRLIYLAVGSVWLFDWNALAKLLRLA